MITVRRSEDRGHAQFGWLDSRHTFSFGSYMDPAQMGFGHLRVINQDHVAPGQGFDTHAHRNMEIISVPTYGQLAHRDSTGHGGIITPGEVQVMSAGRFIQHSEMNGSADEPVGFLQIWILPREGGGEPRYQQKRFADDPGLTLVVSPDGRDGSLSIKQDTDLWRARLPAGTTLPVSLKRARAWVQVIDGDLRVDDVLLHPGDGAAITDLSSFTLAAASHDVDALIFDLL